MSTNMFAGFSKDVVIIPEKDLIPFLRREVGSEHLADALIEAVVTSEQQAIHPDALPRKVNNIRVVITSGQIQVNVRGIL